MIFAGPWYYPGGGMHDFIGWWNNAQIEAFLSNPAKTIKNNNAMSVHWIQIVDPETLKILKQYNEHDDEWIMEERKL